MKSSVKLVGCAAVLGLSLAGAAVLSTAAFSQDSEAVLKNRQATMKRMGADLDAIKAYLDGKADEAKALTGATDLDATIRTVVELFPAGTGMEQFPGKSGAKPGIWTEKEKFDAAHRLAVEKADALLAATKSGDKPAIAAAFADLGKGGCGGCHTPFREKI